MEELSNFRQWGSPTPGHPEVDFEPRCGKYLRSPWDRGIPLLWVLLSQRKFLTAKVRVTG